MCRKIQSILVSVEIYIQPNRCVFGSGRWEYSCKYLLIRRFTDMPSVRDGKMTTYSSSLLLVKPEVSVIVVGEAACRSVSGSTGPGNFTMVR